MNQEIEQYQLAFDEINALTEEIVTTKGTLEEIKDDVLSILINGYKKGTDIVNAMLDEGLHPDIYLMDESIYKNIGGENIDDRITKYVNDDDVVGLQRLLRSEYHRVVNEAMYNGAKEVSKSGTPITKKWFTVLDDKVRETHVYLEGMEIPVDAEFYTFDGDHALMPSMFTNPANNVNCRCLVEYVKSRR